MQYSRRADLLDKSTEFLHMNIRFCSLHFETSQYHLNSKRLKRDAVPTLFDIPNAPQKVTPKRPLRERQEPNKKVRQDPAVAESMDLEGECVLTHER